jgi:hypothetical protein
VKKQLKTILESDINLSITATGGGSRCLTLLTKQGGASKILDSFYFPYSTEKIVDYVGYTPAKFNSKDLSYQLAVKTLQLCSLKRNAVSVGLTCSLAKPNQRSGRENSCYITILSEDKVIAYKLELDSSVYTTRLAQESVVGLFIIICLCNFLNGEGEFIYVGTKTQVVDVSSNQ